MNHGAVTEREQAELTAQENDGPAVVDEESNLLFAIKCQEFLAKLRVNPADETAVAPRRFGMSATSERRAA